MSIIERGKALLESHHAKREATVLRVAALERKIRKIKMEETVDGDEHHAVMKRLNELNNPDRVDGNGMSIGRAGTAQYVRLIRELEDLPTTGRTSLSEATAPLTPNGRSKKINEKVNEIVANAKCKDSRVGDVIRIVKRRLSDKTMSLSEAKAILPLFTNAPLGSAERESGEARLHASQYDK